MVAATVEGDKAVIKFDRVKVILSIGLVGTLYAPLWTFEEKPVALYL